MTEFEIASLTAAHIQAGVAAGAALLQAALILLGFRAMRIAGERRERAADQRHAETMEALRQQGQVLEAMAHGMEALLKDRG